MKDNKDIESGLAEAQFAAQAKAHFDDSVQRLDAATQSRLNRGRQQALAEGARFGRWNQWLPLAGVAATTVLAVVLWRGNTQGDEPLAAPAVADFELLLDQDDFEMLQDLEFYSWIEIDDDSGANVG